MKKFFILALAISLIFTCLAGCGTESSDGATATPTIAAGEANGGSTVETPNANETPVACYTPTAEAVTPTPTPAATAAPTPTPKPTPAELKIKDNFQFGVDYVGNYKEGVDELTCIEIRVESLEDEYIVVSTYYYEPYGEDSEYYVEYNGKKYCGIGGGHGPLYVEITDTEIIGKDMETQQAKIKLLLVDANTLKATYSEMESIKVGDTFVVGGKLQPKG